MVKSRKQSASRILIVDDDGVARTCLEHALASAGYDMVFACDADQAGDLIHKESCTIVISTEAAWSATGRDGLSLCQRVRDQHDPRTVYVFLATRRTHAVGLTDCLSAGADDILLSPPHPAELGIRIHNAERILQWERDGATDAATNTTLKQAKAVLEQKNRRLEQLYRTAHTFVDNVSHEFRTPLTVIVEYTALMQEGALGDITADQQEFLAVIASRADDLNTMVDDMLDSSKLEAGMLSVVRRECRVSDILQSVWAVLERKAAARDVQLQYQVNDDLPIVYVDAEKVRRVLINLAVNAIKFCGEVGKVQIQARLSEDGDVIVGVTDNGPGIETERQKEIFERFQQLDSGGTGQCKGFGLGLSIARELVDLNLGELGLDSQVGHGTTFTFTLPRAHPPTVLERYLARVRRRHDEETSFTLIGAALVAEGTAKAADDADLFLAGLLKDDDLLFRLETDRWLVVTAVAEVELDDMLTRLGRVFREANRNRPTGLLPEIRFTPTGTYTGPDAPTQIQRKFEELLLEAYAQLPQAISFNP